MAVAADDSPAVPLARARELEPTGRTVRELLTEVRWLVQLVAAYEIDAPAAPDHGAVVTRLDHVAPGFVQPLRLVHDVRLQLAGALDA